jgi:hypothetical protein
MSSKTKLKVYKYKNLNFHKPLNLCDSLFKYCKFKYCDNFNRQKQIEINKQYWSLSDNQKYNFLVQYTKRKLCENKKMNLNNNTI